jgi:hypothetical protein
MGEAVMLGFVFGALAGGAVAAWGFYRFYHVNVVADFKRKISDLQRSFDELSAKVKPIKTNKKEH